MTTKPTSPRARRCWPRLHFVKIDWTSDEHGPSKELQAVVLASLGAVVILLQSIMAPQVDGKGWRVL